jgi:hypothetical protein
MPNFSFKIRRLHRFLGITVGIQFLLWTLSGLYFSWSDIDEVHGDPQKKATAPLVSDSIGSPAAALKNLRQAVGDFDLLDLRVVKILEKNYWQIAFHTKFGSGSNASKLHQNQPKKYQLADAKTGELRPPLSEKEALELAKHAFNGVPTVKKIEYLTQTGAHHEFRENPLPAFAVQFEHPTATTVYVSTELGSVQKFRNDSWRIFDFLWMFHTMDYRSRDDFNNWVLRIFSVLGLVTAASGFVLFFLTLKKR